VQAQQAPPKTGKPFASDPPPLTIVIMIDDSLTMAEIRGTNSTGTPAFYSYNSFTLSVRPAPNPNRVSTDPDNLRREETLRFIELLKVAQPNAQIAIMSVGDRREGLGNAVFTWLTPSKDTRSPDFVSLNSVPKAIPPVSRFGYGVDLDTSLTEANRLVRKKNLDSNRVAYILLTDDVPYVTRSDLLIDSPWVKDGSGIPAWTKQTEKIKKTLNGLNASKYSGFCNDQDQPSKATFAVFSMGAGSWVNQDGAIKTLAEMKAENYGNFWELLTPKELVFHVDPLFADIRRPNPQVGTSFPTLRGDLRKGFDGLLAKLTCTRTSSLPFADRLSEVPIIFSISAFHQRITVFSYSATINSLRMNVFPESGAVLPGTPIQIGTSGKINLIPYDLSFGDRLFKPGEWRVSRNDNPREPIPAGQVMLYEQFQLDGWRVELAPGFALPETIKPNQPASYQIVIKRQDRELRGDDPLLKAQGGERVRGFIVQNGREIGSPIIFRWEKDRFIGNLILRETGSYDMVVRLTLPQVIRRATQTDELELSLPNSLTSRTQFGIREILPRDGSTLPCENGAVVFQAELEIAGENSLNRLESLGMDVLVQLNANPRGTPTFTPLSLDPTLAPKAVFKASRPCLGLPSAGSFPIEVIAEFLGETPQVQSLSYRFNPSATPTPTATPLPTAGPTPTPLPPPTFTPTPSPSMPGVFPKNPGPLEGLVFTISMVVVLGIAGVSVFNRSYKLMNWIQGGLSETYKGFQAWRTPLGELHYKHGQDTPLKKATIRDKSGLIYQDQNQRENAMLIATITPQSGEDIKIDFSKGFEPQASPQRGVSGKYNTWTVRYRKEQGSNGESNKLQTLIIYLPIRKRSASLT
jgi:hypothetical protein